MDQSRRGEAVLHVVCDATVAYKVGHALAEGALRDGDARVHAEGVPRCVEGAKGIYLGEPLCADTLDLAALPREAHELGLAVAPGDAREQRALARLERLVAVEKEAQVRLHEGEDLDWRF